MEFLSDEQERRYGRFTRSLSRAELDRFCFLDDSDLRLIHRRRSEYSMLGFGLQLVTARCVGTFLPDALDVPLTVLDYMAGQLGVADQIRLHALRGVVCPALPSHGSSVSPREEVDLADCPRPHPATIDPTAGRSVGSWAPTPPNARHTKAAGPSPTVPR